MYKKKEIKNNKTQQIINKKIMKIKSNSCLNKIIKNKKKQWKIKLELC